MTTITTNIPSIAIDTLKIFNTLMNVGFTKSQAEAIAAVTSEARADLAPYTAKADVVRMEDKIMDRLNRIEERINTTTQNIVFWFTAALFAQGAMVVSLIQFLK